MCDWLCDVVWLMGGFAICVCFGCDVLGVVVWLVLCVCWMFPVFVCVALYCAYVLFAAECMMLCVVCVVVCVCVCVCLLLCMFLCMCVLFVIQ